MRSLSLSSRRALIALIALVVAVVVVFLTGLNDLAHDHDRFVAAVRDAGPWGVLVFVAVMTATVAVGVPGIVFVAAVAAVWPVPGAIAVFLSGGLAASCIRLAFVRSIGRNWVEARLPERFRRWDERLSNGGVRTVLVVRLVSNLAAPADWVLALSRVQFRHFLVGTVIGRIPITILWIVAGPGVLGWLAGGSPVLWLILAAGVVLAAMARRSFTPGATNLTDPCE